MDAATLQDGETLTMLASARRMATDSWEMIHSIKGQNAAHQRRLEEAREAIQAARQAIRRAGSHPMRPLKPSESPSE